MHGKVFLLASHGHPRLNHTVSMQELEWILRCITPEAVNSMVTIRETLECKEKGHMEP